MAETDCGVLHCGVLHCGVLHCGVLHCGVLHCGVLHCGEQTLHVPSTVNQFTQFPHLAVPGIILTNID